MSLDNVGNYYVNSWDGSLKVDGDWFWINLIQTGFKELFNRESSIL